MNLLFIQGGSRLKQATNGEWYTDGNFTSEVWERYLSVCDSLTIVLRKEKKIYTIEETEKRFNKIEGSKKIRIVALEDITNPKINMVNFLVRKRIKAIIYREVRNADKLIIRSDSFYTYIAHDAAMQFNKPYYYEVTGFAFEAMTYHSLLGKLLAKSCEKKAKILAKDAEQAIYVTNEALQKRYPSKKMLGCSDVQLPSFDDSVLDSRLERIENTKDKSFVLGTAAFLDVRWKGQENVIRALALLKKQGITNIYYELIGLGEGEYLRKLAQKFDVSGQVRFLGAKTHNEVFAWLDNIDIYIQPSYQEGLCRAILEAMSRACPVICSNTGGNYELVSKRYIFECGDFCKLADILKNISVELPKMAIQNFEMAKKFNKNKLDLQRLAFLKEFISK